MGKPKFSSDIGFVPVSFQDRDSLVGRIMEVVEAVMPEGKQQDATKSLIKQRLSEYFVHLYNDAFTALNRDKENDMLDSVWGNAVRALWEHQEAQKLKVK